MAIQLQYFGVMVGRNFALLLITSIFLSLGITACEPDCKMSGKQYNFQIPVDFINCKDTLDVNEQFLILFYYNGPNVFDKESNKTYNLTNLDLRSWIHCNNLLDSSNYYFGFKNANVLFSNDLNYQINNTQQPKFYILKQIFSSVKTTDTIFISFDKPGVYAVSVNLYSSGKDNLNFTGKCARSSYIYSPINRSIKSISELSKFAKYDKVGYESKFLENSDPQSLTYTFVVK